MDGITPPQPPRQIADHDLTSSTHGKVKTATAPTLPRQPADFRSPAEMMRSLGFCPDKYMNPVQFLIAVFNDDLDLVFKRESKRKQAEDSGGISLHLRMECAKTAAKYINMEMPKMEITSDNGNFGEVLTAVWSGNERIRKKTLILEQIEHISPDLPLPPANYPPHLAPETEKKMDSDGVIEGEVLNPEGDTGYNPDAD